ncbi:hypothetical protein FisN_22Hu010 [Fistulifera solaris]|uniref:Uncharacterized protein n=1 Tax=Fistulifera solaris TaxID=1519565 RepID=A0A1Z5K2G4_FISSO|nr:hypothetical protein FisN_22Hu010 [Fistulifera solaris]|eukprot:GAX20444.1 hypothetical protein FisN_22Hu010 [Fistulifera solaris]
MLRGRSNCCAATANTVSQQILLAHDRTSSRERMSCKVLNNLAAIRNATSFVQHTLSRIPGNQISRRAKWVFCAETEKRKMARLKRVPYVREVTRRRQKC